MSRKRTKRTPILPALLFIAILFLMGILSYIAVSGEEDTIRMVDHTEGWISPYVQESVRDFNKNMPKVGPKLEYIRGETLVCSEDVTLCSGNTDGYYGWSLWYSTSEGEIHISHNKRFHGNRNELRNTICHEMMHVIADINKDNRKHKEKSCIFGNLTHLGPLDIKMLRHEYR